MLDTTISFTIQDLLICTLIVVAIVTLIFLIRVFNKLGKNMDELGKTLTQVNVLLEDVDHTMKELDGILADAQTIVNTAQKATAETEQLIVRAKKTVSGIQRSLITSKSKIGAAFNLLNLGTSILSIFGKNE